MANIENNQSLNNQIWTTRISRVNAEKRLETKEAFIQGINIYYSCFTVALSVLLLVKQNFAYSLLALMMTIALTISILYFKNLRYVERARDYRKNYTELQRLEFELSHEVSDEDVSNIEQRYCTLLDSGENHISFDYYKTVAESSGQYKETRWTKDIKRKYYWNLVWRKGIMCICIVLPFLLLFLVHWGQCNGYFNGL